MTFHDLCGKEISARGFAVHAKHCTGKDWQPKASSKKRYANRVKAKQNKNTGKEYGNDVKPKKLKSSLPETNITVSNNPIQKNIVKTINLKGEFDKMTEIVNPKESKKDEPKYECRVCHFQYNDKAKYCPGCGVEFA